MKTLLKLLEQNREWADDHVKRDPRFFETLSEIQRPDYLWIGCADSRVPANEIVGLAPGELFVHRNIANLVVPGDPNCMAVVQYAIEALSVRHILVCGHYGCGGVRAVLDNNYGGAAHVERWLSPLGDIASRHTAELSRLPSHQERWDKLCEINVHEQVNRLLASDVLTKAKLEGLDIAVYGVIYRLRDGLLHLMTSNREIPVFA